MVQLYIQHSGPINLCSIWSSTTLPACQLIYICIYLSLLRPENKLYINLEAKDLFPPKVLCNSKTPIYQLLKIYSPTYKLIFVKIFS